MSVQVEKLEKGMAKLTIEVPAEELEKAIEKFSLDFPSLDEIFKDKVGGSDV